MKDLSEYTIFNKWYNILKYYLDRVEKYPRDAKFIIGDRICKIILDIQEIIIECIYTKVKREKLIKVNIYTEQLRIYTRLSFERKYLSVNQYEYLSFEINEFGKMLGGWVKTCKE